MGILSFISPSGREGLEQLNAARMSAASEGGAPRSESVIIMIASGNHSMILWTEPNLNFCPSPARAKMQTSPFRCIYSSSLNITPQNMRPYESKGAYFDIKEKQRKRRTIPPIDG